MSLGYLTHSFEVSVNDLEAVKVGHAGHDLRKLRFLVNKGQVMRGQTAGSLIADGSPLDWILRTASHCRWSSIQ